MEVTMGEKKYPAIKPKFLSGDKPLLDTEGKQVAQLVDYWSWAHSDLIGNTERGGLAEYIVACALGIQKKERVAWDKYDLLSEEGIAVEVKASGYIQTWEQEKLSNITFGIQPTFGGIVRQMSMIPSRKGSLKSMCSASISIRIRVLSIRWI